LRRSADNHVSSEEFDPGSGRFYMLEGWRETPFTDIGGERKYCNWKLIIF
jgi:hypothetical protein